jgi:ABC-type antimicrobial peptide transport system permease subunit
LRGVWERRGELALLQALGFRAGSLAWLVLAENAALLVLGLAVGTASALVAVAPHLAGAGATILWLRLLALLALVVAVGLLAGLAAVRSTLRTPVLTALRRE